MGDDKKLGDRMLDGSQVEDFDVLGFDILESFNDGLDEGAGQLLRALLHSILFDGRRYYF